MSFCINCGSQDFEEEDGQLVCTQCGQQQEGGLQVADDSADFGTQGKISRKKTEREKIKPTNVYRGARASRLYLQAWQHILWKQAFAVVHELKIAPPELWTVARDLWTLRLSKLVARLDANDTLAPLEDTQMNVSNNDVYDTSYIRDHDVTNSNTISLPSLWASVSHVYLSALLLRLPLSLASLYHYIRTDQIPFIRAIRHVPLEMASRLPPEYHRALDTSTIPAMMDLQNAVSELIGIYRTDFHLDFPAVNWRILLFEWIQDMALPIEVYPAAKRLIDIVKFDMTYENAQKNTTEDETQYKKFRKTAVSWPEAQLMAVLVVATKLLFPFPSSAIPSDSPTRSKNLHPSRSNPDFLRLSWSDWLSLHRADRTAKAQRHALSPGKEMDVHDVDVLEMSDEAIDAYMDWYQRTFTVPDAVVASRQTEFERSILNTFPLPTQHTTVPQDGDTEEKQLRQVLCERVQNEALLPGDIFIERHYPIFTSVEQLEATSTRSGVDAEVNPILLFHQMAADTACMDMKALVEAVRYAERRVEKWFEQRSKTTTAPPTQDISDRDVAMD